MATVLILASAAAGAQGTETFDILEYQIEGNEVLPVTTVERAVYPFLGEKRTVADVERARSALEKAYRNAGYLTVQVLIPEQEVRDKVVRLTVTSGKLSKLRVTGARYYAQGRLQERAGSLQEGTPLNFPAVQKDIGALNRNESLRVVPVLRPGSRFGTTEVDLNVTDQRPYGFNTALTNYFSPNTTSLRLSAGVRYDNLWQREHAASVTVQTSPQDTQEVRALSASYAIPLRGDWGILAGYYVASDSSVAVVGDQTVLGKGSIGGLRWSKPLPAVGSLYHSVTVGADYKDYQQNVGQPGGAAIDQPIRYVPGTLSWSATKLGKRGVTALSTGLVFGISALSDGEEEFQNRRFNASPNFVLMKLEASRTQKLTSTLSAFLQVDGQLANGPLIVNEQFLAGGASAPSVRGYLEAEKAGDNGAHATFELRRALPAARVWPSLNELQLLLFADWAHLTTLDPLPQQEAHASISSAGLGLRARALSGLRIRMEVGVPFSSTTATDAGKPRVQFSASYQY